MAYSMSESLVKILNKKEIQTAINLNNFDVVIDYIIKNCNHPLSVVAEFIKILKEIKIQQVELGWELERIFENLIEDMFQEEMNYLEGNDKIVYPIESWNTLIKNKYISKIIDFIGKTLKVSISPEIKNKLNNIKIIYSCEEPNKIYGEYTNIEIVKTIEDYIQKNPHVRPYIRERLDRIANRFKRDEKISIEETKIEVKNLIIEYKAKLTKDEVKGLEDIYDSIDKYKLVVGLLGCFNSDLTITLYVESIFKYATKDKISFKKALIEVFAHELFHAFHYLMVGRKSKWEKCSKIIIESFAAYFEYIYSNYEGIYVFNRERNWNNYGMYRYPYSGAKYIKKTPEDFDKLFKLSLTSNKEAFKFFDVFYRMENI